MVNLPTSPTISCGTGELPVAVVATYAGGLIPVSGAKVDFSAGTFIFAATNSTTTNILGLAQTCHQAIRQVSAYIQKDGIDFGSGVGVRHLIGNSGLRTGPYMFPKVIARTQAPGVAVPSLPPKPTLPALPPIPNVPTPQPVSELCSKFATKVDSINHPAEITDFNSTFYVYLRGVKEICETDPTNPAFINKVLKGTKGTITLGNLSSEFKLTDDGVVDIDLSKLVDLRSLAGAPSVPSFAVPTPQPVVIQPPPAPSRPTGRLNGNVAAAQDYINRFYPGKGTAQVDDPGWARFGSVKIVRTNRSYFHTATLEDIGRLI